MTLVVADTGPIHYLVLIEAIDVLPRLYDRIIIPTSVHRELRHPNAPILVKQWTASLPGWAEIRAASRIELLGILGSGEAEAIALAQELQADSLLLDETEARQEALRRKLPVSGTIGVLEKAAERGFLILAEAFQRLARTNFRMTRELVQQAFQRDALRRKGPAHG
jgi:predicted nucleic acid-binding protein